ncbi:unnamed protein product [Cuscuta europaea]|uniref:Retrovirus-related Pol polyprotein from transposon TNT 1-94-like beta-barrel domain-containing protein n=1 Tax=Cuscuta europaea TaxID=41803 RepID=A0A9P1E836_CUSEU|nr:unnamed protein product [Cuscuta europaea]
MQKYVNRKHDPHKHPPKEFCAGAISEQEWFIDSGCSRHMTSDRSCLIEFQKCKGPRVTFGGNDKEGQTKGRGKVIKNQIVIDEVSYVKGLKFNLLSCNTVPKYIYF